MSRRRFFADALDAGSARIAGPAAQHLSRVLRAQPGQEYELAHAGRLYLARIRRLRPQAVDFEVLAELPAPPSAPALEIGVALFKFDRFEWMLEKATELGAGHIWPLSSRRSSVNLAAAAPKRRPRWQQIVRQAAEQSRRAAWPEVAALQSLEHFLTLPFVGTRLLLSEDPQAAVLGAWHPPCRLLAGPEGGFAPEEAAAAAAAGWLPISLGPRILRCETAILAALVLAAAGETASR